MSFPKIGEFYRRVGGNYPYAGVMLGDIVEITRAGMSWVRVSTAPENSFVWCEDLWELVPAPTSGPKKGFGGFIRRVEGTL